MQVTRKIAAAAAVATVATLGLATVVSANMIDDAKSTTGLADAASLASKGYGKGGKHWYWVKGDGSLVSVDQNNLGPFQACHNFVPVNAVGGQVPVTDITGIVGLSNDGNSATAVKTCELDSEQNNSKWYRVGDDGLVSVSRNNVGPFQVCHNDVPVNAVGGQVPVSDLAGVLGLGNDGNSVDVLKTCELDSEQDN
ncbi:hypothetical protein E1218_04135 [Kribbella turkmenica]|uniref:Secreted protein n=1 Tax=Kribbella turkmenica TaxID=2530375 RepID=A0A4R4XG26_9ACTN|nr:hypothetical protein [Kribbella turkmenica]TDD29402.1 hypothetical protein E1218_04135 [Kribbella turkmenica]